MKKIIFLLLVVGFVSSCTTNKTLVQRSDVAIENVKTKEVYFCKCGTGTIVYDTWLKYGQGFGWFNDVAKIHLVDSTEFNQIPRKFVLNN
jgi:outer membrane lipoprotein-sorting protein